MTCILKKILITGGNGFLGRSFAEKLNGNIDITICSRTELDLMDSVAVQVYLKKKQFDVILHTATYDAAPKNSVKDKNKVLEHNLTMFFNLVRCDDYFGKMIYFGSGAEFDRTHWKPKMTEEYFDHFVPTDQYGFSKYVMTKHALLTDKIINLRLFGVFGEYDDWRYRFIPNACCHSILGMPINIHQNSLVDFLYIDDLVRIVYWFINNKPRYQVYNVCSGWVEDSISWANEIRYIADSKLTTHIKYKHIKGEYSGNNSRLINELVGFEFLSMRESVESLYSWYVKNKKLIDAEKFHF